MKTFLKIMSVALALAGLAGCTNLGYNGNNLNTDMTPDVSQKGYVRTYDQNGNPTVAPAATTGTSDPANPAAHSANGSN
jgi:hypothetical protein